MPEATRVDLDASRELRPGDCVAIFTSNDENEVNLVFEGLGKTPENIITSSGDRKPGWIPDRSGIKDLIRHCFELRSPVTKAMIGNLAENCTDPAIKRRLSEMISREGKEIFLQLLKKQVTFVHLLTAFPKLNIDLSIFTFLRQLQRRWYSIANFIDYRKRFEKAYLVLLQV